MAVEIRRKPWRQSAMRKYADNVVVRCHGVADSLLLDTYRMLIGNVVLAKHIKTNDNYWIPRLIKQRPDLYEKLLTGEIASINKAIIAANWRKK